MTQTVLTKYIKKHIEQHGPLGIDQYMNICLCHPEHGYYMKKDPFGKEGDFTTAPEISQLFGDMIGLWVLDQYNKLGRPEFIELIECGPGRGTLMSDIARIASQDEAFASAVKVRFVEMSPTLKKAQELAMSYRETIECAWHESFTDIAPKHPVIIIANEFFDALPLKQFIFVKNKWHQRVVGLNAENKLELGLEPADYIEAVVKKYHKTPPESLNIFEYAPLRDEIAKQFAGVISENKGAALIIDYGFNGAFYGDTFQALIGHQYCKILEHCGDADLTSHVNFHMLHQSMKDVSDSLVFEIATQGSFLSQLGVNIWYEKLVENNKLSDEQQALLSSGLHRLIDDDKMGELFKVLSVTNYKKN